MKCPVLHFVLSAPHRRLSRPVVVEDEHGASRRLTTGILSEKCVVRQFRRCANVIECAYTNLDNIVYHTPGLYGIAYCS
jgi:hypothetical protein